MTKTQSSTSRGFAKSVAGDALCGDSYSESDCVALHLHVLNQDKAMLESLRLFPKLTAFKYLA